MSLVHEDEHPPSDGALQGVVDGGHLQVGLRLGFAAEFHGMWLKRTKDIDLLDVIKNRLRRYLDCLT
jgi:hypothetical protein